MRLVIMFGADMCCLLLKNMGFDTSELKYVLVLMDQKLW
jgi:hypothetical protein